MAAQHWLLGLPRGLCVTINIPAVLSWASPIAKFGTPAPYVITFASQNRQSAIKSTTFIQLCTGHHYL